MEKQSPSSVDHLLIDTPEMNIIWHGPDCGIEEEELIQYLLSQYRQENGKPFSRSYPEIRDTLDYKRQKTGLHYPGNYALFKDNIAKIFKTSICLEKKNGKGKIVSKATMNVLSSYNWDDTSQKFTFRLDDDFVKHVSRFMITGIY